MAAWDWHLCSAPLAAALKPAPPTSHFPGLSLSWHGVGPVARGPEDAGIHCLGHGAAGTDSRRRRPFEFPLRANESEAKCNLSVSTVLIGQEMVREASAAPAAPSSRVFPGHRHLAPARALGPRPGYGHGPQPPTLAAAWPTPQGPQAR